MVKERKWQNIHCKYNIDEEFKAIVKDLTTDMAKIATEFDSFIE